MKEQGSGYMEGYKAGLDQSKQDLKQLQEKNDRLKSEVEDVKYDLRKAQDSFIMCKESRNRNKKEVDRLKALVGEWVSVGIKTPPLETVILIFHVDGYVDSWYFEYLDELKYFTHWMPLPQPPQK